VPRKRQPPAAIGNPNDPHGMGVLLDHFLEWLRIRNFSEHTVDHRRTYLGYFINWAEERGIVRPADVTKPILERFQRWLFHYRQRNGKPLSFRTQTHYLTSLRAWFKWLARQNHILYNPASELELPKLEHRLPKFVLTATEADVVMNQTNVATSLGVRDRAILETFYSTGMRRNELRQLNVCDVDVERGVVVVRQGKNKKDRTIPIGGRALLWMQKYQEQVRPGLSPGDAGGVLFLTEQGMPLTAYRLSQMVRRYVAAADLGKTGSCHLFRHTLATLMLENGADVRFVQAMLGHANLSTTQIYTHVSIRKLKQIHEATHPARLQRTDNAGAAEETLES